MKTYLIITTIGYPAGGGESFLYQTTKWFKDIYECIWVSFCDKNGDYYIEDIEYNNEYGALIYEKSGGINSTAIISIIQKYKPIIIHIQGQIVEIIHKILFDLRIPTIVGFHFWNGLIILGDTGTINILENKSKHKKNNLISTLKHENFDIYFASEYMQEVVNEICSENIENIIYPISDKDRYYTEYNPEGNNILMMNIHKIKGGDTLLEIAKLLPDYDFLVVCSETTSKDLDEQIREQYNIKVIDYTNDIKSLISKSWLALLPTHGDETFCRVANEFGNVGLPMLVSKNKRYLSDMLGDSVIYIEENNIEEWKKAIIKLKKNKEKRLEFSKKLKERMKIYQEDIQKKKFTELIEKKIEKDGPNNNIMIFCPWCDQGLGIHSRIYADILMENNYRVHIFSFLPYLCTEKQEFEKIGLQSDPNEWKNYTSIYYSYNDREHVTNQEIIHFIRLNNIGICLIVEICYSRIFEIAQLLKDLRIKCFAIPNIECVRLSEISLFKNFYSILCTTRICENKLIEQHCDKISYLGHGFTSKFPIKQIPSFDTIKFLHIAGLDSLTRKNTLKVIEAFNIAKKNLNIHLTITIQGNIPKQIYKLIQNNENITIIEKNMKYNEIISFYDNFHVIIQPSTHEGLGLIFYEAISRHRPCITINTSPHNEIIENDITGWLINCLFSPLTDNNESVIQKGDFNIEDLAKKIEYISYHPEEIIRIINLIEKIHLEKWSKNKLSDRLIFLLNNI